MGALLSILFILYKLWLNSGKHCSRSACPGWEITTDPWQPFLLDFSDKTAQSYQTFKTPEASHAEVNKFCLLNSDYVIEVCTTKITLPAQTMLWWKQGEKAQHFHKHHVVIMPTLATFSFPDGHIKHGLLTESGCRESAASAPVRVHPALGETSVSEHVCWHLC